MIPIAIAHRNPPAVGADVGKVGNRQCISMRADNALNSHERERAGHSIQAILVTERELAVRREASLRLTVWARGSEPSAA
jgi:hypothetical protein